MVDKKTISKQGSIKVMPQKNLSTRKIFKSDSKKLSSSLGSSGNLHDSYVSSNNLKAWKLAKHRHMPVIAGFVFDFENKTKL